MALPETHLRQIARWCEQRLPESIRHRAYYDADVDGSTVTIMEHFLPVWDPDHATEWTHLPLAQLRFDGSAWRMYHLDRDSQWQYLDEAGAEFSPGPLLEALDDPRKSF